MTTVSSDRRRPRARPSVRRLASPVSASMEASWARREGRSRSSRARWASRTKAGRWRSSSIRATPGCGAAGRTGPPTPNDTSTGRASAVESAARTTRPPSIPTRLRAITATAAGDSIHSRALVASRTADRAASAEGSADGRTGGGAGIESPDCSAAVAPGPPGSATGPRSDARLQVTDSNAHIANITPGNASHAERDRTPPTADSRLPSRGEIRRQGTEGLTEWRTVLLTISTTAEPASDLGFLLHKHPGPGAGVRPVDGGRARVLPGAGGRADDRRAAARGRPGRPRPRPSGAGRARGSRSGST